MIKCIIFDFGDVYINLDKPATERRLIKKFNYKPTPEAHSINKEYEIGKISTEEFLSFYKNQIPNSEDIDIIEAWNAILLDFPKYRLDFIKNLKTKHKYKLILLSNTNHLHINWIKNNIPFYHEFKSCFDQFYLSHEINLRKPNKEIFNFVLEENSLTAEECLFIDDTSENTNTAKSIGMSVWNNNPDKNDIVNLFDLKKDLF